jgi:hypothetical protein
MVNECVNFFGHAAVASWTSAVPGVVLGAMVPDFATMAGARVVSAERDADLAAGIAIHHATDAAFHALPSVTGLMRELDGHLARLGCARGPRRAVAHVGVELLLDGVLVAEPSYRVAYTRALAYDASALAWREADDAERFAQLLSRLRTHGVPDDLRRTDAITARLSRMLRHRPLLAPSPDDLVAIHTALEAHRGRVGVATDTGLRALRVAIA